MMKNEEQIQSRRKIDIIFIIRAIFFPVFVFITAPISILITIYKLRVLGNGKWLDYSMFRASEGINSLFYWSVAESFLRYGRRGISPYIGDGNYELSRLFNFSLPSLYIYRFANNISIVVGLFFWLVSHFIWLEPENGYTVISVVFLSLISPLFYYNIVCQNYNILGWMFYPLLIYYLYNSQIGLVSLFLLLSSFGGVTQVFVGNIITIVYSIFTESYEKILELIPANIKILTHFFPMLKSSSHQEIGNKVFKQKIGFMFDSIFKILGAIGMIKKRVKYKRPIFASKIDFIALFYYIIVFGQFIFFSVYLNNFFSIVSIIVLVIFFINVYPIFRFADYQTLFILILTSFSADFIMQNDLILLPSYWIALCPAIVMLLHSKMRGPFAYLPPLSPFNIKPVIEHCEKFLEAVPKNSKVLFSFSDPRGNYNKIFDGYRVLLEVPVYIGVKKEFLVVPNWWMVFKYNKEGDPEFWGRKPEEVLRNMRTLSCDFCVIYQGENEEEINLDEWRRYGFEVVSELDWKIFRKIYGNDFMVGQPLPKWYLLKLKS